MLEGRVHDRFDQYAGEARIFGAQLVRQRSAAGVESVFGNVFPERPRHLDDADPLGGGRGRPRRGDRRAPADRRPAARAGRAAARRRHLPPDLAVARPARPTTSSRCSSTRRPARRSGATRLIQRQSAVGTGTGVLGDRKKLSTRQASSVFLADDALRPPTLITYDLKGNYSRVLRHPGRRRRRRRSRTSPPTPTTPGPTAPTSTPTPTSASPTTTTSSASAAAAWTATTGRSARSCTRRRARIRCRCPTFVLENFLLNAFWCGECGQPGQGYMVFGEGLPTRFSLGGQNYNYFAGRLRRRRARAARTRSPSSRRT